MTQAIEPTASAPVGDNGSVPPAGPVMARSIGQVLATWTVRIAIVGGGLVVGAILGLVVSLFAGIIDIRC